MKYNKKNNNEVYFLIISILIHLLLLTLFFLYYHYSNDKTKTTKKNKNAKVIFKTPKKKPLPKKIKIKPKKKTPPPKTMPAFQGLKKPSIQKKTPQVPQQKIQEKKQIKKEQTNEKKEKPAPIVEKKKTFLPKQEKRKPTPYIKKVKKENKRKLTLADITKGLFDYTKKQGTNLVRYTKSKKGTPTDEQIKHEMYVSKVLKCINTTIKIKKENLVITQPVMTGQMLVVDINILLNHNGTVSYVSIVKHSGIKELDQFMIAAINDSSSSFPPVPRYLSDDKYFLPIRFNIPADRLTRASHPY